MEFFKFWVYKEITMSYRFIFILFILITMQFGCTTARINFNDFLPVEIQDSKLPTFSEQYLRRNTTVIVAPFNSDGIEPASIISKSNLSTAITGALEKYLSQAGVQIYDGDESQKKFLIDSAKKYEFLSDNPSGLITVDYVIFSRLNSFDIFNEYIKPYQKKSFITGKVTHYPAQCKYTIHFSGTIRIYDGISRTIVKSLEMREEESYSIDTMHSCSNSSDFVISMARKNAEEAINKARTDIQYFFSPNAYVLEKRKHKVENKYIVSITCGKRRLFTTRATVSFYKPIQKSNKILYEKKTGTGQLTNQMDDEISWVLLDDPATATHICKGDIAKVKFHQSVFQKVKRQLIE